MEHPGRHGNDHPGRRHWFWCDGNLAGSKGLIAHFPGKLLPGYRWPMPWILHHVHIAIPPGSESTAREFYGGVLGCDEVARPDTLADRGEVWFRYGGVELHLGVDESFHPAGNAHPGILVGDLDELDARLTSRGYEVQPDYLLSGYRRFYVSDPFGNRLEFLAVL